MAPGIHALTLEIQASRDKNRLRKPVVEKLRRERINSSIQQLKQLLEKEFQRYQPNSKLEKADVLEMTVSYLKYSPTMVPSSASIAQDYSKGYSSCLKETLQFLSIHSVNTETQAELLRHFQKPWALAPKGASSPCPSSPLRKASPPKTPQKPACKLWRPW